jgi:hypothetical protein
MNDQGSIQFRNQGPAFPAMRRKIDDNSRYEFATLVVLQQQRIARNLKFIAYFVEGTVSIRDHFEFGFRQTHGKTFTSRAPRMSIAKCLSDGIPLDR